MCSGKSVGPRTNNEAEYLALIRGLEEALRLGVRKVSVSSDSELVVRQLSGEYEVRSGRLQPLHERALVLSGAFESFDISHIRRTENGRADRLAKEGMDIGVQQEEKKPERVEARVVTNCRKAGIPLKDVARINLSLETGDCMNCGSQGTVRNGRCSHRDQGRDQ